MPVVVLDGAPQAGRLHAAVLRALEAALAAEGAPAEFVVLRERQVMPCDGCFDCWVRTPGRCRYPDDGDAIARRVVNASRVVLVTPVVFGGYSALLKGAIDRLLVTRSPFFARQQGELFRRGRYGGGPALVAIGLLDAPDVDAAAVFARLVERNALHLDAPAVASDVLQATLDDAVVAARVRRLLAEPAAAPRSLPTGPVLAVRP